MKGRQFKDMIERLIGDDQDIVIADPQGAIYDVKVVPFLAGGPVQGRFIVIPNYNKPEVAPANTGRAKLLPRPKWQPDDLTTIEHIRDALVAYKDAVGLLGAKEFLLTFYERHGVTATQLIALTYRPDLWRQFVIDLRSKYEA